MTARRPDHLGHTQLAIGELKKRSMVTLEAVNTGRRGLDSAWMSAGRCTQVAAGGDWEMVDACWFGERNSSNKNASLLIREAQAKRQCSLCPIRARCLAYALENEGTGRTHGATESGKLEPMGIFGGLTGRERASVGHLPESERILALERILAAQQPKFLLREELDLAAP